MHKYKWAGQCSGQRLRNCGGSQAVFVRNGVHNSEISLGLCR